MVNNETLLSWPGVRYAAYSSSPIYKKLRSQIPKAILYSGGSVIHPAIDFAVQLGVKTRIQIISATVMDWRRGEASC